MLEILQQATTASQQGNWSVVNRCLQQLLSTQCSTNEEWSLAEAQQVLQLALGVIEDGDFQERWEVAKFLPKLGAIAIAPTIAILKDREAEWEARWFAARILGGFEQTEAIAPLLETIETAEDEELAAMAASVLGNFGLAAVRALTDLLCRPETRELAARSLSQIRRRETIDPLLTIVGDPEVRVRAIAIEALSSFRDARIPPVLLQALQDPAPVVRKEAVIGLGLRSDLAVTFNLIDRLKPLLYDFNGSVCAAAAIALGRMGTPEAAALLFEVLRAPATPFPLQIHLVRALVWVETADNLDYLRQAMLWVSLPCLEEIVKVLGRIKSPALQPTAMRILQEIYDLGRARTVALKQALAQAWGQLQHPEAIAPLEKLLVDPNESVRLHAIAALKHFQGVLVQF
jgi:HEAT repeat protein